MAIMAVAAEERRSLLALTHSVRCQLQHREKGCGCLCPCQRPSHAINRSPQIGLYWSDLAAATTAAAVVTDVAQHPSVADAKKKLAIYKLNSVKLNYFICRQGLLMMVVKVNSVMTWFSSLLPIIMASPSFSTTTTALPVKLIIIDGEGKTEQSLHRLRSGKEWTKTTNRRTGSDIIWFAWIICIQCVKGENEFTCVIVSNRKKLSLLSRTKLVGSRQLTKNRGGPNY